MKYLLALSLVLPIHSWYPSSCCADRDCHPVPCDELTEKNDGSWQWYVFVFKRDVVKPSQDRLCHVCTNGPNGICAFIQQGV